MQRRSILCGLAAVTLSGARSRGARACGPINRAAVVIGVDRAGDLPRLHAAAAAAGRVADWLEGEGFEVKRFLDTAGPVRAGEIYDAIEALVKRGTLDQLVIYFGGHGFLNNYAEHWLLSEAPDNPNEAVSLVETVELARVSGIPSVVLVSDACRSLPDTLRAVRVRGSLIFPNQGAAGSVDPEVDRFFATRPGGQAWEVPEHQTASGYRAIFTESLLSAYQIPDHRMVNHICGRAVVPNRLLKKSRYLQCDVKRRSQSNLRITQTPQLIVESGDDVFIGHHRPERNVNISGCGAPVTVDDLAARAFRSVDLPSLLLPMRSVSTSLDAGTLDRADQDIGFGTRIKQIVDAETIAARRRRPLLITVHGRRVHKVFTSPRLQHRYTEGGAFYEVGLEWRGERRGADTVFLQFEDGSGIPLAVLDGFAHAVVADESGVRNVSYVPAGGWFGELYREDTERLGRLHGVVATAASFGAFRFEGDRRERDELAERFFERALVAGKLINPTLAPYLAIALAEAGLRGRLESLSTLYREYFRIDLFDLVVLANARDIEKRPMFPICPMLSPTWNYLRIRGVDLPDVVREVGFQLRPALWTTFQPSAISSLIERHGELLR